MKVPINRILPYSVVDGPGNRVAIFVQKCNISCLYCHNPETQRMCVHCGECALSCPTKALEIDDNRVIWNKDRCVKCDTCIKICRHHASPKITYMDAKEVMDEVRKSYPFIRGITVSGGECTLYPEFLKELFTYAKKDGLTTLIDSNGIVDLSKYPELLEVSDGVMLDVKAWSDEIALSLYKHSNRTVKENLKFLSDVDKLHEVRIVCLDKYVDAIDSIDGIKETLGEEKIKTLLLKLIRFRRFGVKGVLENMPSPSDEYMNKLKDYALKKGYQNIQVL